MTISFWLDEPRETVNTRQREVADVVIVGGGVIGAGCAYMLAARENLKVVLLESQALAGGSSGRSGGFILRGIQGYYNMAVKRYGRQTARQVFEFAGENQELVLKFVEGQGNSFEFEPCGSYLLACSLEELDDLSESAELLKEDGLAIDFIKNDPLERDFYGALFNRFDAAVNPARFVRALALASTATIHEGEPLRRIESDGEKLEVRTPRRIIECDRVLVCTNAYTPLFEPWFLDKLKPARGQALITQPLKKRILNSLCYANYGWEYFRQLSDNRLLVGGCRQMHLNEEMGYADMITKPVQSALENYIKDRFPEAVGLPIEYRWSGLMSFTADGLPLVGELKKLKGVYFALGMNGHGLSYGLAMSKLLVELALDGKSPEAFDAARASLQDKSTALSSSDRGP